MSLGIKTKVTCPVCNKTYNYQFVPGASFTALRLGKYRYMKCQNCGHYALFDIYTHLDPAIKKHLLFSQILGGAAISILGLGLVVESSKYTNITTSASTALLIASAAILVLGIGLFLIGAYLYLTTK